MSRMIQTTISEKVYRFLAAAFAVFLLGFLVCKPAIIPALWPGNEESGQVYLLLLICRRFDCQLLSDAQNGRHCGF